MADQTLADYLNQIGADSDTVQQGFRYYLAERTDDLPTDPMRQKLVDATGNESAVRAQLVELEHSSERLEAVALLYLSGAWQDVGEREAIKAALTAATQKLPVIETAIMAVVAMYAMYLLATGGKQQTNTRAVHRPDGSFETNEETVYGTPDSWIDGLVKLVTRGAS